MLSCYCIGMAEEVQIHVELTQEQAKKLFMLATGAKDEYLEIATVPELVENACITAAARRYALNEANELIRVQQARIAQLEAFIRSGLEEGQALFEPDMKYGS